jgi:hypothetical protein
MARIVYLALADARGHLMRAHILRGLLRARGIDVDVLTTSHEGQRFLAAMGTPSDVLSEHFAVAFGGCHDMARAETDACVLRYYLNPRRGLRDLVRLARLSRGAAYVVCDSLHPALLVAPLVTKMRVVHVFGENIWAAALENFAGRAPAWFDRLYRAALEKMRAAAFACIVHALDPRARPGSIVLPPILPAPARTPARVREALGLGPRDRLAAVYLNPHFADPRVADAIERALARRGYRTSAVGEGYADRPGWRARDADLASVVRAADLFVSGAGMGALAQARVFGTPLLAILGDQPEQRKNAEALARSRAPFATVSAADPRLEQALDDALARLSAAPSLRLVSSSAEDVHAAWADAFERLVTKENTHEAKPVARPRNQQSAFGQGEGRREPRGAARASARADAPLGIARRARRHA